MKNNLKPTITLSAICVAVALLLSVINMITGPIIEERRNAAANGALLVVMPEGKGFEELSVAELGLSNAVTNAYKETSGKGYVFRVVTTGYKPGMTIMVGVDSQGKVTGTKCLETQDTFGKEPQIDGKYNGQTLSDFSPIIITGATMTSNGYRDAVNIALQSFVLASGGKLDPSIELEAKIPELVPAFKDLVAVEASGNIVKALKAKNDTGFAYIIKNGENYYLATVNAMGACKVFNAEGGEVTAESEAIIAEAKAHAAANQVSYNDALKKNAERLMAGATDFANIELNTFNTVVSAVSFTLDGAKYYGFYSRSVGFRQMDVYIIIDENGAIAKIDAKELIFDKEYFMNFGGMNVGEYKAGFEGLTIESWNGDAAIIATATMTSNAMKESTTDAFDAFHSIKGGEQ